jgi:hypothetical protein
MASRSEPVRLKFCGVSLTRGAYLALQVGLLVILGALVVVLYRLALGRPEGRLGPWARLAVVLVHNLYWIVPVVLVLDGIEVLLVLRRFAEKEAQMRKKPPAPSDPAGSGTV